jgi:hypothetical protein
MGSISRVRSAELKDFSKAVLQKMGVPLPDAEVVSTALVDADLRGLGTHGAGRLTLYAQLFREGLINPRPRIRVISESSAHVLLDNDYGMGFLGSVQAMDICIRMAGKEGIAMAGVRNSSHFGAAGYYALMAAGKNLVGFATSNSYPVMAPPGTIPSPLLSRQEENFRSSSTWLQVSRLKARSNSTPVRGNRSLPAGPMTGMESQRRTRGNSFSSPPSEKADTKATVWP